MFGFPDSIHYLCAKRHGLQMVHFVKRTTNQSKHLNSFKFGELDFIDLGFDMFSGGCVTTMRFRKKEL